MFHHKLCKFFQASRRPRKGSPRHEMQHHGIRESNICLWGGKIRHPGDRFDILFCTFAFVWGHGQGCRLCFDKPPDDKSLRIVKNRTHRDHFSFWRELHKKISRTVCRYCRYPAHLDNEQNHQFPYTSVNNISPRPFYVAQEAHRISPRILNSYRAEQTQVPSTNLYLALYSGFSLSSG